MHGKAGDVASGGGLQDTHLQQAAPQLGQHCRAHKLMSMLCFRAPEAATGSRQSIVEAGRVAWRGSEQQQAHGARRRSELRPAAARR